jgi:hypothetical protein
MTMSMSMTRALASVSKFSGKFFHEGLPIALASVIGATLVAQFNHPSASPPIVLQASPPPEATRALSDEHELIIDLLKRDAETKRLTDAPEEDTLKAGKLDAAVEERPAKARSVVAERILPQRSARLATDKKATARDPLPPVPTPTVAASTPGAVGEGFIETAEPERHDVVGVVGGWAAKAAQLPARLLSAADRPIEYVPMLPRPLPVVGAVGGWVANAAQLPGRFWMAADRPTDDAPSPPMPVPGLSIPHVDVSRLAPP